ncbi:siderophore-interacting protein [Xanthomonas theicola]|uniref:siderophore-interacting protein n=1 Tax=Xanthomonas theicola TaxID=56464 RepID=UPI0026CCD171
MTAHDDRLLRHPPKMRHLHVLRTQPLTPHMLRIVVVGPALDGFASAGPDDRGPRTASNCSSPMPMARSSPPTAMTPTY